MSDFLSQRLVHCNISKMLGFCGGCCQSCDQVHQALIDCQSTARSMYTKVKSFWSSISLLHPSAIHWQSYYYRDLTKGLRFKTKTLTSGLKTKTRPMETGLGQSRDHKTVHWHVRPMIWASILHRMQFINHFSGPVRATTIYLCVPRQDVLYLKKHDLDIRHTGSSWHWLYQGNRFIVTEREKYCWSGWRDLQYSTGWPGKSGYVREFTNSQGNIKD